MNGYDADTLIVGAGPSGLAMAACLTQHGLPYILIERGPGVGAAWHTHYERLHLHTVKRHSNLPFFPFPDSVDKFPPRQAVADYLESYARHFDLKARCGEEVSSVKHVDDAWITITDKGHYRTPRVVIASGYNRRPVMPKWPGRDAFQGTLG